MKQWVENRKQKTREVAEKNKLLKKKTKRGRKQGKEKGHVESLGEIKQQI